MDRITINVAGKKFVTYWKTIQKLPKTRLGRLTQSSPEYDPDINEFFFDRDPKVVNSILNLYRTRELHLPSTMCGLALKQELEFWDIPEEMISECCWNKYTEQMQERQILNILDKTLGENGTSSETHPSWKEKIWLTMEKPFYSQTAKVWNLIYLIFVLLAIVVFTLSSVRELRVERPNTNSTNTTGPYHSFRTLLESDSHVILFYLDVSCIVFFTLELPLRFVVSPSKKTFFRSFMNLVDLALVFIMWGSFFLDEIVLKNNQSQEVTIIVIVLRSLLSLRILRIFHIARRFDSMKVLFLTYKASIKEIFMLFTVLIIAINIFGTLAYFAEVLAETNTFENIPVALWWAIITMTTVGYGDYYPESIPGYVVGIICALSGLVTLSMPIAIIATNFSAYYSCLPSRKQRHRRCAYMRRHGDTFEVMRVESYEGAQQTDGQVKSNVANGSSVTTAGNTAGDSGCSSTYF
ncbi:potassium voltage-gated channel protein Shaw-like [Haliotis cracherodii]|uniref:potassium voltage-gated channel protein Shaw-like n=1 Tax=Haliotis cracherodii TaxID=6455 RepID=UPI0039EAA12C